MPVIIIVGQIFVQSKAILKYVELAEYRMAGTGIRTLLVLLCLAPHYGASVEIVGTPDVTVYEGENATLSCTTSCITDNSRVLWSTNVVWLVNVLNELNIENLGSRHSKFSVSVFNETCIPNKTLNLTSKLSIVDVALAETGTYICSIATTNIKSNIKLNVVPLWLPICSRIPAFAAVGDLVTVSCVSEAEFLSTLMLSMSMYDQNERVLKTMNQSESTDFAFNYVHTITPDDDAVYFICETTFYINGKELKRRTCTTNTINIIPTTSVQVIPLNNTPFHSGEQVCFICIFTTGSFTHLDAEYSWSRIDHEKQVIKSGSGSKQHCIDRISLKYDQQLIICNVSNKYQYATGNISIVVVQPTTNIPSCDRSFSSELLLWLLLPTNICILMVIVILVTCPRKRKNNEVENLQLSRLQEHMDDESVPENIYDGYDAQDSPRLSDEHGQEHWFPHEVHQFPDTQEPGQESLAEEMDLRYLYQATIDTDAGHTSHSTEDQGQLLEVGQNLRQNQYEHDALPRLRSLDTEHKGNLYEIEQNLEHRSPPDINGMYISLS